APAGGRRAPRSPPGRRRPWPPASGGSRCAPARAARRARRRRRRGPASRAAGSPSTPSIYRETLLEPASRHVHLRGHLHSPLSRLISGALVAVSRLSLPALAAAGLLGDGDLLTTPVLVGTLLVFAVLPGAAAWMIERAAAADVTLSDDLGLRRADLRLEVPRASIERVRRWALPVPGPGLSFTLRSGRRLGHGLELADPLPLLAAFGDGARTHPVVVWAHARAATPPWGWHHVLWKFVGFALAP